MIQVTSTSRQARIRLGVFATLLTAVVLVMATASASADGNDANVRESDLPGMVLSAGELSVEFSDYRPDPWSGFTPPDEREPGEINTYALYYSPATYEPGLSYPGTMVGLFTDADAAVSVIARLREEAQNGGGEVDLFEVSALGDETIGLTFTYEYDDFAFQDTAIVFRSGRMLGASIVSRDDLQDTEEDAVRIAQALLERMKRAMNGEEIELAAQLPPDTNCDGAVDSIDAALILQTGAGLGETLRCGVLADVSNDGRTDAVDAAIILQFVAGIIWDFSGDGGPTFTDEKVPPEKSGGITALLTEPGPADELYPPFSPSDSTLAVDCDVATGVVQSACSYPAGSNFSITLNLSHGIDGGYAAFDTQIAWDDAVLDYVPTEDPVDEAVWDQCAYAMRFDERTQYPFQPSVHFGCVKGPRVEDESFQLVPELGAGPVVQFQFRCVADGTATVELLPRNDQQEGTYFLFNLGVFIDPALTSATITCGRP